MLTGSTRRLWALLFFLSLFAGWEYAQEMLDKAPSEPEVISIFPLGGRQGTTLQVEVRGRALEEAYGVWFDSGTLTAHVHKVEEIELDGKTMYASEPKKSRRGQRVLLQLTIDAAAAPGIHRLRLVSPRGVSSSVPLLVHSDPVLLESDSPHHRTSQAQPVSYPVAVNGRISEVGEVDYYGLEVSPGQELMFEVISKPADVSFTGAGGFDPQLTLYENKGSWFDPQRAIRLAFNDEPHSENISTNPRLIYRFSQAGRYLVSVGSFLGKGGPDHTYLLRIVSTGQPAFSDKAWDQPERSAWRERAFTRKLEVDRLQALWSRTVPMVPAAALTGGGGSVGLVTPRPAAESPSKEPSSLSATVARVAEQEPNDSPTQALEVAVPTLLEGTIEHPGDVDHYKFKVKAGQPLAFEIETPQTAPPQFNPRLAFLGEDGREFLTNIYKRIGRNFTFYLKTVEAKTVYTFELEGEYTLQVRDVTSRWGDPSFKYRLLIRPQIPHVGEIQIKEDRLNLVLGEAKKLTVTTGQEEGFSGEIAITVEGLPLGVEAFPGTAVEPDRGPPLDEGYKERFVPKSQKATLVFLASADAPTTTMPQFIRILGRPIVEGKPGPVLAVREVPLMVVKKSEIARAGR